MDFMKLIEKAIMKNSKTKIVYFLDRNVISIIKDINEGRTIDDQNKLDILDSLNNIDFENSIITPMFSLFEGQHGRIECVNEIPSTVAKEVDALKKFFKKARIDDSFQMVVKKLFEIAKSNAEYQKSIQDKISFLKEVNQYLYQPLSLEEKTKAIEGIKSIHRDKYFIYFDKFNPVVVAALFCLCGNDICKKILKPKKDVNKTNYYNAVMDFQHFTMFAMLVGQIEGKYSQPHQAKIHCEFLSGDKYLEEFFSWFKINQSSSSFDVDKFSISVALTEKGISNIPDELKNYFGISM